MITANQIQGMEYTLHMLNTISAMNDSSANRAVIHTLLNLSWTECSQVMIYDINLDTRQLFFSIIMSFGDIANRAHNVLLNRAILTPGGHSLRKVFLYCLEWMHEKVPEQFYDLFPLFGEYYNLGANTIFFTLWTDRREGTIREVIRIPIDVERVTTYIASILQNENTTTLEKKRWARWLWHVPTIVRRRAGKAPSTKQGITRDKDVFVMSCIKSLSRKMDWPFIRYESNIRFTGYEQFRKEHMCDSEAHMFSSHKIKELRRAQLFAWFDSLPYHARLSAQRKLLNKDNQGNYVPGNKWINNEDENIGTIYLDWHAYRQEKKRAAQVATVDSPQTDLMDMYSPLLGIFNSERYSLVRELVR